MNIDDELYLLTRKETGESFVCNMSLEELGETILEEECLIKEHGGEIPSLQKDRNSCVHVTYIIKFWMNLCVKLQNKYFKK